MFSFIEMSTSHDVGISPVLLQAISQSLSSTSPKQSSAVTSKMEGSDPTPVRSGAADQDLADRILKQQREQVSVIQSSPAASTPINSDTIKTMLKIKMAADALTKACVADTNTVKLKKNEDKEISGSSASDIAMANVLTALASQGGKAFVSTSTNSSGSASLVSEQNGAALQRSSYETKEPEYRAVHVGDKKLLIRTKSGTGSSHIQQEICTSSDDTSTGTCASEPIYTAIQVKHEPDFESVEADTVPSSESNVLMSAANLHTNIAMTPASESVVLEKSNVGSTVLLQDTQVSQNEPAGSCPDTASKTQLVFSFNPNQSTTTEIPMEGRFKVIEHEGKRYILQTHDYDTSQVAATQSEEPQSYTVQIGTADDGVTYTSVAEQEVVTVGQQQEEASVGPTYKTPASATPCPVCGDNVSGKRKV